MEMQCRAFIAVVGSVAVALGGLASYGPSLTQMWRKAAVYVDKILKGRTRQSRQSNSRLSSNLAKSENSRAALGLTFPDTALADGHWTAPSPRKRSLEYAGLRGEGSTPVPLPPPFKSFNILIVLTNIQ